MWYLLSSFHPVFWLSGHWGLLALAGLFLVERRGSLEKPDPKRQVPLATLLESMPEAVFVFDTEHKVVDSNLLAEQLTGLPRSRISGMKDVDLESRLKAKDNQGKDRGDETSVVALALRGEVVRQVHRIYLDPRDGDAIEALVSGSPMRNEDSGEIVGALVMIRDVTEMTQLQRRLADTQRHHAIGQMAAGIAHDFNNVLDTISQAAFLLDVNAEKPASERKAYSELIRKAVRRGAEINDRVRDYLRTGTGEQSLVDLRQLMDDVVEMTRPMWQLARKTVVRTHFGPVAKVCANPADMRRVFTNLIINALEAMPDGGVLTLRCEDINGTVRVMVEDTGEGIGPEEQKKMFVPYFTTKKSGTGLGLSGAQKIISNAGGNISFRSQVGKGTCFVIDMPATKPPERARGHRERALGDRN
jgi:two-component system sensor histidine kinase HydH